MCVGDLKPCPLCGGEAILVIGFRDDHGFGVRCHRNYCACSTRGHPTQERAIASWNSRRQNISDVLIEALEPFALEASEYDCLSEMGEFGPDYDDAPDESSLNEINGLKVGDLRRARDALRQAKGEAQ